MPSPRTAALADRYALDEVIGRGGMADVYRGRDLALGRSVAVKVLRETTADPARFISEARTLASLSHPSLVTLLDAGTDGTRPYLVMELVDGTTLAARCRDRPLDTRQVATIGAQLADALAYVHRLGIVHRDVKPGNVLLSGDGRALLTDFGIAKLTADGADLTGTGLTMGTAAYLAPEQLKRVDLGPATDVYSLGLVLLEALTGERAYPGPPAEAAFARLRSTPAIPGHLPARWRTLLHRMTALRPGDRPAMSELATVLADLRTDRETAVATAPWSVTPPATQAMTVAVPNARRQSLRFWSLIAAGRVRARALLLRARSTSHRRRAAVGVIAAVLLPVLLFAMWTGRDDGASTTDVPSNLPPQMREDLENLHRAVDE